MTLPSDEDLAALLADAPERMFIDDEGDLCRGGGGDNLVASVAHDDIAPWPALNPKYLRLAALAPDLARAVLDLRAENARLTAERDDLYDRLEEGNWRFGIDPATRTLHTDDGGAPEGTIFYVPKEQFEAAHRAGMLAAAEIADEFHWVLPMFTSAEINLATDDAACAVQEQIAAAIRAAAEGAP